MKKTDLLDYLKERYNEEQARFNHFENKCSRFLTFLSGLIGALTIFGGYAKDTLLSPSSFDMWVQCLLFYFALFSIVCAWGHSLLALKIDNCPVLPKSKVAAEYIRNSSEDERLSYLFDCYVDTITELSNVIDQKAVNLEHAYNELTYSAWSLALLSVLKIWN